MRRPRHLRRPVHGRADASQTDAEDGPGRYRAKQAVICAVLAAVTLSGLAPAGAETVREGFEFYPIQIDTTGFVEQDDDGPITIFRITGTGNTGPADPIVAGVGESLAASAGIAEEGDNKFWTLGASAGATVMGGLFDRFVLSGGFRFFQTPVPAVTGPIGDFFAAARDLNGATFTARVRETTGVAGTQFQFVLFNQGPLASGQEIATAQLSLTNVFQTFTVTSDAFTILLGADEGPFDFTRVTAIVLDFFAASTNTPALSFNVDDIRIDTPERPKAMPWLLLLRD